MKHCPPLSPDVDHTQDDRLTRGNAILDLITGPDHQGGVGRIAEFSPDLAHIIVAFAYGEVLARPGLDLRLRQICTISSLLAQGSMQGQLRFHIDGLLNVGGTPTDLIGLAALATAVLGYPAGADAAGLIQETFKRRGIDIKAVKGPLLNGASAPSGADALAMLLGRFAATYRSRLEVLSHQLTGWTLDFAFREMFSQGGLDAKASHLAVIAMLATIGNQHDLLRLHTMAALDQVLDQQELLELLIQLGAYAGFPAMISALETMGPALAQNRKIEIVPKAVHQDNAASIGWPPTAEDGSLTVLGSLAPDADRSLVDHYRSRLLGRSGSEPKARALALCSALAGHLTVASEAAFRAQVCAAHRYGATADEVTEALLIVAAYRGYPAAQHALAIARSELVQLGAS
jgi:4-carboxymuconolactone decarboxylase